jgi:hypothetical protein
MNKNIFFTIFGLLIVKFLVSADEAYDARQYFEYVSFGYNAVEYINNRNGRQSTDFYILNNPLYSNIKIWDYDYGVDSSNPLSSILGSSEYHLMEGYRNESGYEFIREWPLKSALHHYYGRYEDGYTGTEGAGMVYETDRNGRMVSARYIHQYRESETVARSIRYNRDGSVNVDFGDWSYRFYNIPGQELVNIYLTAFTQTTRQYLNILDDETLQGRTKEELAIIRNCLFAKYSYAFQSSKWRQFMINYYDSNYQGRRSNQEIMDIFNENERRLLEKIIKYENR